MSLWPLREAWLGWPSPARLRTRAGGAAGSADLCVCGDLARCPGCVSRSVPVGLVCSVGCGRCSRGTLEMHSSGRHRPDRGDFRPSATKLTLPRYSAGGYYVPYLGQTRDPLDPGKVGGQARAVMGTRTVPRSRKQGARARANRPRIAPNRNPVSPAAVKVRVQQGVAIAVPFFKSPWRLPRGPHGGQPSSGPGDPPLPVGSGCAGALWETGLGEGVTVLGEIIHSGCSRGSKLARTRASAIR